MTDDYKNTEESLKETEFDASEEEKDSLREDSQDGGSENVEEEQQEDAGETKGQKIRNALIELAIYVLIIVVCVVFVPRYVIQRTIVEGTSMESTLQDEDNLLVEKVSYHFSDPKRFDVIVFYPYGRHPSEDEVDDTDKVPYYIKRVIGLPGETIQITGDTIYIDGEVLEENFGKDPMTYSGVASDPLKLGDDEYFVLGDNRSISEDSRYEEIGPVSREKIAGHAVLRIYPFSKFGKFK